jgi:integrase
MRGLRRGEVLGLQWTDIDFTVGVLHVRRTRVDVGTEGIVTRPPKTSRGRRTLPLDPPLVAALRHTQAATVTPLVDRWLTVDAAWRPMRPEAYSDLFVDLATEAGLPLLRLHDARHTAPPASRSTSWPGSQATTRRHAAHLRARHTRRPVRCEQRVRGRVRDR